MNGSYTIAFVKCGCALLIDALKTFPVRSVNRHFIRKVHRSVFLLLHGHLSLALRTTRFITATLLHHRAQKPEPWLFILHLCHSSLKTSTGLILSFKLMDRYRILRQGNLHACVQSKEGRGYKRKHYMTGSREISFPGRNLLHVLPQ